MQGGVEFKNEIELLSRVHHKNLVGLVGFCFEQGEQMLVYEYIPNGTIKESLSGTPRFFPSPQWLCYDILKAYVRCTNSCNHDNQYYIYIGSEF